MVKVTELKADLEALRASQARRSGGENLLSGFLVSNKGSEGVRLLSFDGVSATSLVGRNWGDSLPEGDFVLSAEFGQLLGILPADAEVKLTNNNQNQFEIRSGRSKWKFRISRDCDSFVPLGDLITNGEMASTCISFDAEFFRESLLSVYPSLGADQSGLNCVQLIFSLEKREFTTVATDSRRSTVWRAVNVDYPELPEKEYSLIIPGEKILQISKFLKTNPGKIDFCFSQALAVFESAENNISIAVRTIESQNFPLKLYQALLQLPIEAAYGIKPKVILPALKRIKVLLPTNKILLSRYNALKFDFSITEESLTITHEFDLFTEDLTFQPLIDEKVSTPPEYTVALNLEYVAGALSLLGKEDCELRINPRIVAISSTTLHGTVSHYIATIEIAKDLYKQNKK